MISCRFFTLFTHWVFLWVFLGFFLEWEGDFQQNVTEDNVIFLNCFVLSSIQSLSPSHKQVVAPVNMENGSAWSEYHNHKWTGAFAANVAAQT